MEEYLVPGGNAETELVERRSRFIGRIWRTDTEAEALEYIRQTRERHWDATHNVYAYIIKDGATRYSDDGEPQGTAGMPVLEVLRREGLFNVCCVVTRYFGGVLLGAGGLVRAYAASAGQALAAAGVSEMRRWVDAECDCPYPLYERVRKELTAAGGMEGESEFGEAVKVKLSVPSGSLEHFQSKIIELSSGQTAVEVMSESLRAFPLR